MSLTKEEIKALSDMVVAGGKSPNTGGEGLMIASELIRVLQRELKALDDDKKSSSENVK